MVFNSWTFAALFAIFLPLYFCVRKHLLLRNCLLIFTSYIFYGWWDWRFLILVAISTSVDYLAALGASGQPIFKVDIVKSVALLCAVSILSITASNQATPYLVQSAVAGILLLAIAASLIAALPEGIFRRRLWLGLSLTTNLGILGFFKYYNFFIDNIIGLTNVFGADTAHPLLTIILPVGLSFYSFQAISRTIDSYTGTFQPKRSIINYAAYHAFFPQLVAGPIERAGHLMPQFESILPITSTMLRSGSLLFLWGLYKKVVIADNISPIADAVFNAPDGQSGAAIVNAILAFTFQIYCDFSGYSDMARGIARCLGFDLMKNFDLPYFSRSPQEFWRRWHISLSRWLRDYLYFPLGGSRNGSLATYRNLMITMLLGGLWHGAAWTFVIWGAFHGLIQVVYRAIGIDQALEAHPPRNAAAIAFHLMAWAVTFILVAIGWVFFRARSFHDASAVLAGSLSFTGYGLKAFHLTLYYILPLIIIEIWLRFRPALPCLFAEPPFLARYTAVTCLAMAVIVLAADGGKQFIYFDF